MITLPVSSSVYQSMVANIQQIHTNGDGTLCITPMQVQKSGHQHLVGQITNITSITSQTNTSCNESVNSSFSSASNDSSSIVANCHVNSQYGISPQTTGPSCENQLSQNNNLLELCRVLNNSNQNNGNNQIVNPNNCYQNSLQPLSSALNVEKKLIKSKKVSNRNQFNLSSTNFMCESSSPVHQEAHMNRNNTNQLLSKRHDNDKANDRNNNINGEDNDLKCVMMESSSESNSQRNNKINVNMINVQFDEVDSKNIKMECEIDAT